MCVCVCVCCVVLCCVWSDRYLEDILVFLGAFSAWQRVLLNDEKDV